MKQTATNQEVKRYNKNRIYRHLLEAERTTKQELAQVLGLSMPTVLQNTRELEDAGLLTTAGCFASTGGRKAQAIVPVRDAAVAVGLDITRNHVSLVLADLCGGILKHARTYLPFEDTEEYAAQLHMFIVSFLEETPRKPLGAAVIIPGIVAQDGKRIVHSHVLEFSGHCTRFDRLFDCPVRFFNDSNAAAFAEFHGRQTRAVYLSLSNSVGGAVYEGKLVEGDHCRAGEFGHMTLKPAGSHCYCGQQGCADVYLSASVLAGTGRLEDFFERAAVQEAAAWELLHIYLADLSVLVNNLRMAFDCDVMLGGYVGSFLEPYWSELAGLIARRSTFDTESSYLLPCRYRVEAAALGGALQFMEEFIAAV